MKLFFFVLREFQEYQIYLYHLTLFNLYSNLKHRLIPKKISLN